MAQGLGRRIGAWFGSNWLHLSSIVAIPIFTILMASAYQDRQSRQRDFELAVEIESQREKHSEKAKSWAAQQIALYTGGSEITLGSLPPELKKRLCFAPRAELLEPIDYKKSDGPLGGVIWKPWGTSDVEKLTDYWELGIDNSKLAAIADINTRIFLRYEQLLSEIKAGCEAVQQAP